MSQCTHKATGSDAIRLTTKLWIIPEALVLFFLTLQNTTLFFVETYLDMDKYEGQSSFNLL